MVGHVLLCVEPKVGVRSSNKVNTGTPKKRIKGFVGTSRMSTHTIIIQDTITISGMNEENQLLLITDGLSLLH
jgi:hypothetical protein